MNFSQKKKCQKGGEHHNRYIEALCLQQQCKNDRLLCFYCIHNKHENHQIIYLLEGLESPIQKLSINSTIQNKQQHQKYIQKRIKKINKGWKSLYRVFQSYIKKLQSSLQPQIAVVEESFDCESVGKFVDVITDANTSEETIDRYVQKLRLIMKYDLGDIEKVKVSTGVAYEELRDMYKWAHQQIESIMGKVLGESNIFQAMETLSNDNMGSIINSNRSKHLGIDYRSRISISVGGDTGIINRDNNQSDQTNQNGINDTNQGVNINIEGIQLVDRNIALDDNQENGIKIETNNNDNSNYSKGNDVNAFMNKKGSISRRVGNRWLQRRSDYQQTKITINRNNNKNKVGNINKDLKYEEQIHLQYQNQQPQRQIQQQTNEKNQNNQVINDKFNCDDSPIHKFNAQLMAVGNQNQQPYDQLVKCNNKQLSGFISLSKQSQQQQQIQEPLKQFIFPSDELLKQEQLLHSHQQQYQFKQVQQEQQQYQPEQLLEQQLQQEEQEQSYSPTIQRYRNYQYPESQQQSHSNQSLYNNTNMPTTISLNQIYLCFHNHHQILHQLNKIPSGNYPNVQSLQIYCDSLPLAVNEQIINKIILMRSLKKLTISQAHTLKIQHLELLLDHLPLLQHLVLEQHYAITLPQATLIKQKLRKLKKFHYTSDPLNYLFFKQQNSQFLSEIDGKTKLNAIQILTSIPTLQTISFQDIHKLNQIKKIVMRMVRITELSIIFHQRENKVNHVIDALGQLKSTQSLLHLQLKQCYFQQASLISLLQNCHALKSFILNKCRDVTDNVIITLKKHKHSLKQIDLMQQDEITGIQFQHFTQLQILSLKACWKIQEDVLGQNIVNLHKLISLNLNFNRYWVTEKIFDYIGKLENLESLSIDNNKVNFSCLVKLQHLEHIVMLSCGNTELSGEDILKFLSLTRSSIKKISLKRETYQQKSSHNQISNRPFQGALLKQISRLLPHLSHLNIKGMKKVNKDHFQNLKNLRCLSSDIDQLNQETISFLTDRGVSLYIGYSHYQKINSLQIPIKSQYEQSNKKPFE